MKKVLSLSFILAIGQIVNGQKLPLKSINEKLQQGKNITAIDFGFKEYKIKQNEDTIRFYTYQRNESKATSIFLYLPGTNAEHIYSFHKENDSSY